MNGAAPPLDPPDTGPGTPLPGEDGPGALPSPGSAGPGGDATMATIAHALEALGIAMCLFDFDDRAQLWNRSFLRFFPEHAGHIHVGEPYEFNLRRFYLGRLGPDELPQIDAYVAAGVERHRTQQRSYTFQHNGQWLRVVAVTLPQFGRLRLWSQIDAGRGARRMPAKAWATSADGPRLPGGRELAILEHMADGVMLVAPDDRIAWVNESFVELYGLRDKADAVGLPFIDLYSNVWSDRRGHDERRIAGLSSLVDHMRFAGAAFELPLPDDRWVSIVEQPGAAEAASFFVHADVTTLRRQQQALELAERRARESEARYRLLAEHASDIILLVEGGRIAYACPAVRELLGWEPEAVTGRLLLEFVHPEERRLLRTERIAELLREGVQQDLRFRALTANHGELWVEARAKLLPAEGAAAEARFVINIRDISQRKAAEEALAAANAELEALAVTDPLTGLANRRLLESTLEREWRRGARERQPLSLLLIDVDHFKDLNDRHGHDTGDEVLRRLAALLERSTAQRGSDLAARFGGEEFAIVLGGTPAADAARLAERLRLTIAQCDFGELLAGDGVTASFGVATADPPMPGEGWAALLRRADAALYRAKRSGRNRVEAA